MCNVAAHGRKGTGAGYGSIVCILLTARVEKHRIIPIRCMIEEHKKIIDMKIVVSENKAGIDQIRQSIKISADLARFDQFIAKYPTIDICDSGQQMAAGSCQNSCGTVTISPTITLK